MNRMKFYTNGKLRTVAVQSIEELAESRNVSAITAKGGVRRSAASEKASGARLASTILAGVRSQRQRLGEQYRVVAQSNLKVAASDAHAVVIPTEAIIVEGARKSEIKWLRDEYGLEISSEGAEGKILLSLPDAGSQAIQHAFNVAQTCFERGNVRAAHPNFVRVCHRTAHPASGESFLWNLQNNGEKGVFGADVHAREAWTITTGNERIRVAILDEGVDTGHPALQSAVVAEKDFVDENATARPDGDDAHGTACAGIVMSRDAAVPGLAPQCGLVAVRIAKGDGADGWVFDDFNTADAIDWTWKAGRADVLSNSWGGGPPVDVIRNAFERARTKGRQGKGAVIVIAAGNENGPISFPGTLDNVLTVGASNQWDERKSTKTQDGEDWWGSNYGPCLSLLAPGVKIATTDIAGKRGYSKDDFDLAFNGTSSAAPHVAAAAALLLSVKPKLSEARIRAIITKSADPVGKTKDWNKFSGYGRLNLYAALREALK